MVTGLVWRHITRSTGGILQSYTLLIVLQPLNHVIPNINSAVYSKDVTLYLVRDFPKLKRARKFDKHFLSNCYFNK